MCIRDRIISGGPMMGFAMFSLDIPTTKTSSSILCFTHDEVAAFEMCIRDRLGDSQDE